MTTLSVVATLEASNVPPRVKVVITDTGTPTIFTVTPTRTDQNGLVTPLRTSNGAPLTLVTSGSNRVGTVYDYEMPYGLTVNDTRVWLINPGVPDRSMPITLWRGTNEEEAADVLAGIFKPLGRRDAVVISDGKRKAPSSELIVGTDTEAEAQQLEDLLSDASTVLLNVPPSLGLGMDTQYIFISTLRRRRLSDVGTAPQRVWTLPYQVVTLPVGGSQSQWTWADVLATSPTWQDLLTNYGTCADVYPVTTFFKSVVNSGGIQYSIVDAVLGNDLVVADIPVVSGSVTDVSKPGIRRKLDIELFPSLGLFDELSPSGIELHPRSVIRYPSGVTESIPMGKFGIDSISKSYGSDGAIKVKGSDRWARIQRGRFLRPEASMIGEAVTVQITKLLRDLLGPDAQVNNFATSTDVVPAVVWEKDRDKAINRCGQLRLDRPGL
jgi:hypothetical protein